MPALPLIQRPESVELEKKSYRLSFSGCPNKHRRCKTFPGNDKSEEQLIDNSVNNEILKESELSFFDQWYFANKHGRNYDVTSKTSAFPSPTPSPTPSMPQRVRKSKTYNKHALPRWVSQLGLWFPPTKKLFFYESFARHVELLDRRLKDDVHDHFPHLGRCSHARTLSALKRQQLRIQLDEENREAERFERLLDRFKKITETWASFQKNSDARGNEHTTRLQAFRKLNDQYVDPRNAIRQKRLERELHEKERRHLQEEARQKEFDKRRRKIPKIIITDYDKDQQELNQDSSSSLNTESLDVNMSDAPIDNDNESITQPIGDGPPTSRLSEYDEEPTILEMATSPIPSVLIEDVVDNEKDETDGNIAMSFLYPPAMSSLLQDSMLIEHSPLITDDTAALMTGITPVPLGLSTGLIPDSAIRSSSSLDRYHSGAQARLNNTRQTKSGGAWCPKGNSTKEYLEVDLGSVATVMQVATQGYHGGKEIAKKDLRWVTSYTLAFSNDGKKWSKYQDEGTVKVFEGNEDNNTVVLHSLLRPADTRYVRFYPKTWRNGIAMRVEVYGAFDDDAPERCEPAISPDSTLHEEPTQPVPIPSHHTSPKLSPEMKSPSPQTQRFPTPITRPLSPPLEVDEESEEEEGFQCLPDRMTPLEGWEEETIQSIVDGPSEEEAEEHEVRLSSACLSIQGSKKTPKLRRKPKKPKPVKKEKKKKTSKKKTVKLPSIPSAMTELLDDDDDEQEEQEEEKEDIEDVFRIATPPLPEIPKRPVGIKNRTDSQRFSMFPSKPTPPKHLDSKLSRARADNSIRDELLRQQLADDRKKKLMNLKTNTKRSSIQSSTSVDSKDFGIDVDSFIFKYCILSGSQVGYYRRIFDSFDEDQDGFLFPEDILDALECVNKNLLENSHLKYIYRVLELCDCSLESGADFKFFSVVAAFSQKIAALDDYAKILISTLDFRELDYKLQRAKSLFKCYADENTGKMSMEHLTLELTVGGLDTDTKDHVLRSLGSTTYLDFLDFLTYIPLFIHIHDHVLTHPLHDPRSYPSTSLKRREKIY